MTELLPAPIALAEWAEWFCRKVKYPQDIRWSQMALMAAELRRLHAENARLQARAEVAENMLNHFGEMQ